VASPSLRTIDPPREEDEVRAPKEMRDRHRDNGKRGGRERTRSASSSSTTIAINNININIINLINLNLIYTTRLSSRCPRTSPRTD
jgi:hypothetical protein